MRFLKMKIKKLAIPLADKNIHTLFSDRGDIEIILLFS
jgi:hypothetical protein